MTARLGATVLQPNKATMPSSRSPATLALALGATVLAASWSTGSLAQPRPAPSRFPARPPGTIRWSGAPGEPKADDVLVQQQRITAGIRRCLADLFTHSIPGRRPEQFPLEVVFSVTGDVAWTVTDGFDGPLGCVSSMARSSMHVTNNSGHPVLVLFPLQGTAW